MVDREDFKALFVAEPSVLAEFSIRFLGHEVSLNDILHHPLARESFLRHCEKEFATENVEFWKAVEDFEALQVRNLLPPNTSFIRLFRNEGNVNQSSEH